MGAAAVVTVSMVPGYRSSSVRFSKDEGQVSGRWCVQGLGVVDRAEHVDCGIDSSCRGAGVAGMSEVLDGVVG